MSVRACLSPVASGLSRALTAGCALALLCTASPAASPERTAKQLFGSVALPADMKSQSIGFYSRGCMAGAVGMPVDGPNWQTMRLSRNRRWGQPALVRLLEDLSVKAARDGWTGLMVGDMSQPRGGPMLTGHASHQIGLDADIWFTPMPPERLTYEQRENLSATSMLKPNSFYVDDKRWTKAHENLLRDAASYKEVERILVHPGIKKKLCDTVTGDRAWLAKIRPNWGHNYHFHLRLACQDGSPGCRKQNPVTGGQGCDASLDWWFNVELVPKKPTKPEKPVKPKPEMRLSDLPSACAAVLDAPAKPADEADLKVRDAGFSAPAIAIPAYDPAMARRSKPIEAKGAPAATAVSAPPPGAIPTPTRRPRD